MPEGNMDPAADPNERLQVCGHKICEDTIEMTREGDVNKSRPGRIGEEG
jgi:hypothetical protein